MDRHRTGQNLLSSAGDMQYACQILSLTMSEFLGFEYQIIYKIPHVTLVPKHLSQKINTVLQLFYTHLCPTQQQQHWDNNDIIEFCWKYQVKCWKCTSSVIQTSMKLNAFRWLNFTILQPFLSTSQETGWEVHLWHDQSTNQPRPRPVCTDVTGARDVSCRSEAERSLSADRWHCRSPQQSSSAPVVQTDNLTASLHRHHGSCFSPHTLSS